MVPPKFLSGCRENTPAVVPGGFTPKGCCQQALQNTEWPGCVRFIKSYKS
jgi:hypothetical protein